MIEIKQLRDLQVGGRWLVPRIKAALVTAPLGGVLVLAALVIRVYLRHRRDDAPIDPVPSNDRRRWRDEEPEVAWASPREIW